MKNKSLFIKSMLLIIVPILLVSFLLLMVSKSVIEGRFRDDSFNILHRELLRPDKLPAPIAQNIEDKPTRPPVKNGDKKPNWSTDFRPDKSPEIKVIGRVEDNQFRAYGENASSEVFELDIAIGHDTWPLDGESELASEPILFSVKPLKEAEYKEHQIPTSEEVYYIAYISGTYSGDLSKMVIKIFIVGLTTLLVVVAGVLFYVFKHMTKRLSSLERGSVAIGKGDFSTRLTVEPYDEIGRLGEAMNSMSRQLALIQEGQADQFQMISHELKTPIMVMQGYLDALLHNQYPSGSKEASYKVLNEELYKLEQLTQDIIILNKLDYLSKNKVEMSTLSLRKLFMESAERMNLEESVEVIINGEMTLTGDLQSWLRVIENLLSNNLRYAETLVTVELGDTINIKNDGPQIEEHLLSKLKKPFVKGKSGRSGLGLTIVTNILKLYHFDLDIKNYEHGVEYNIKKEV